THGVGDLVQSIQEVPENEIDRLIDIYQVEYTVAEGLKKGNSRHGSLRDAARIELGLKHFMERGNYRGFTDTFEDLHGMKQLPGIGAQRLMQAGYGFA